MSNSSVDKMKKKKGLKRIPNYAKNLIKSTTFAAGDFFKETMPSVSEFAQTNSEFNRGIIRSIRNHKQVYKNTKKMIADSKSMYALKQIKKNAISDLKTGKLYNSDRKDKNNLESAGWGDMLNQDDFFNDDFSSMESTEMTTDDIVKQSTDMIGGAIVSGANSNIQTITGASNSIISANADLSNGIIASNTNNTTRSILNESRLFNDLNSKLHEMHETNVSIATSLSNTNNYYNKSMEMSETMLNSVNEISANIKELLEMKREQYQEYNDSRQTNHGDNNDSPFDYNGTFDISKYMSNIKKNMGKEVSNMFGGMDSFFGEDGNMLLAFAGSPLEFIPKMILSKTIGTKLKKSMKDFDKTFKSFIQNGMSKFTDFLTDKDNSMGTSILGNIFGIKKGTKNFIDTGKYVKGAVPFDGITKKSITDVIPTYLRKILAAITNSSEMIYSYDSGKFASVKELKKSYEDDLDFSYTSAFSKVNNDILNTISQSLDLSERATSEYSNILKTLEKSFADSGRFFNPNKLKTVSDLRDAGIYDINAADDKYQTLIRTITNFGPDMWNELNSNIRKSTKTKDDFVSDLNNTMSNSGRSALFNGFDEKIKKGDEYGKSTSSYLRNIYKLLVHGIKTFPQNIKTQMNRGRNRELQTHSDSYFSTLDSQIASDEDEAERRRRAREQQSILQDDPNHINDTNDLIRRHGLSDRNDANNLRNSAIDEFLTSRYGNNYNLRINNLSQLGMEEIRRYNQQNNSENSNTSVFGQLKESLKEMLNVPREIGKSFLDNARITMNNFLYGDDQSHTSLLERFNEKIHEFSQKIVDGFNDKVFKPLSDFVGSLKLQDKFNNLKEKATNKISDIKNTILDGQSQHIALFSNKMFGSKSETMSTRDFYNSYIKNNTGGLKKGAAIGAVASLFTPFGLVGGTLLGGSLGTFASSETFKTKMFGEVGEDGKRKGGLISKSTMAKFEKMMPNLKKSVGIGTLASLFTPFGLVGGALLGGSIGFASHLSGVQKFLFGTKDENGNINDSNALIKQKWINRFKEMLPGMKIGTGAGLLSSIFMPYGPIGGAVFGLTTSIIGQNKTVKKFLFGDYDPETNEGKTGLFQKVGMFVHAEILSPLKAYGQYMIGKGKNWLTENMVNPFLESLEPIKKEFSLMKDAFKEQVKAGWQSTKDFIGGVFEKHVGKPFGELMEEKFINPMKNMFKKMFGGIGKVIGNIVKAPVNLVHGYAMNAMQKHIKNGNADYLEKWQEKKRLRDAKLAEKKAKVKADYDARKKRNDEISQLLKDGKYDLKNKDTQKARALMGVGIDIKDTIKNSTTSVKDAIFKTNGILDRIAQTANNIFSSVKNFANEKIENTKNRVNEYRDRIKEEGGVGQAVKNKYDSIVDSVKSFFDRSDNTTSVKFDENRTTIETGNGLLTDIKAKISEFVNKTKDKAKNSYNNIKTKIGRNKDNNQKASNNHDTADINITDTNTNNIKGYMPNTNINTPKVKSSNNNQKDISNNDNISNPNIKNGNKRKKSLIYDDSLSTTNKYLMKIYDNVDGQIRNVGYNTMYIKKLLVKKFGKLKGKDIKDDKLHKIRSIFSKPKEFIKRLFGAPVNFIKGVTTKVKNFVGKITELPKKILGLLGKGLGQIFKLTKGAFKVAFKAGAFAIKEGYNLFKYVGKEFIKDAKFIGKEVYGAVKFFGKEAYGAVKFFGKGILKTVGSVASTTLKIFGTLSKNILSGLGTVTKTLLKGFGKLLPLAGKVLTGALNVTKKIAGGIFNGIKGLGRFIGRGLGFGRNKSSSNIDRIKVIDLVKRVNRNDDPIFKKIYNKIEEVVGNEHKIIKAILKNKKSSPIENGGNGGGLISNAINYGKNKLGTKPKVDGSHKDGLSYVPKDGYIAELHKGERVLTEKENTEYNTSSEKDSTPVNNPFGLLFKGMTKDTMGIAKNIFSGMSTVISEISRLGKFTGKGMVDNVKNIFSGISNVFSGVYNVGKFVGKGMSKLFGKTKSLFNKDKDNSKNDKDGNLKSIEKHFKEKDKSREDKKNKMLFRNNKLMTESSSGIYKLLSKTYSKKGLLGMALTGILGAIKWVKEKAFGKIKDLFGKLLGKLPLPFGNTGNKLINKAEKSTTKHVAEKAGEKATEKGVAKHVAEKGVEKGVVKHAAERSIVQGAENAVAKNVEKRTVKGVFTGAVKKVAASKSGMSLKSILTKIFESSAMKKICGSKLVVCFKDLVGFLCKKLIAAPGIVTKIATKWGLLTTSGTVSAFLIPAIWYGSEMSLGVAETKKIFKVSPDSSPTAMMRLVGGFVRLINNNITFGLIDMNTIAMFIGNLVFSDKDRQVIAEGQNQLNAEFEQAKSDGSTDAQNIEDYNYEKNKTLVDRAGDAIGNTWNKIKEGTSNAWGRTKEGASNLWNRTKEGASNLWSNTKEGASNLWEGTKEVASEVKDKASELWGNTKDGISKLYANSKDALITTDAVFGEIFNLTDDNGNPIAMSMWTKNKASKVWDSVKEFGKNTLNKAKDLWGKTKEGMGNAVDSIGDGLKSMNNNIGNALGLKDKDGNPTSLTAYTKSSISNGWEWTKETSSNVLSHAKNLWNRAKEGMGNAVDSIGDGLSSMYDNISDALGLKDENGNRMSLIDYAKSKSKSAFSAIGDIVNSVKDLAGNIWGKIKDKFTEIKDNIGDGLNHLDQTVGSTLGFTDQNGQPVGFIDGIKNKVSSFKNTFFTGAEERKVTSTFGGEGGKQYKQHGYVNNKIRGGMGNSNQFSQNDPRWANMSYGDSGTLSSSGCGPLAAASALSDVTGQNISPLDTMQYALQNGYRDYNVGTTWDYFNNIGNQYGVNMQQTTDYNQTVKNALKQGKPVIISGTGGKPFTDTGHYIVGKGMDASGNVIVNDPESNDSLNVYGFNDVFNNASQAWVTGSDYPSVSPDDMPDNIYGFGPGGTDAATATKIMNTALGVVGTPYVWGGKGEPLTRGLISNLQRQYPSNKYSVPDKFYDGKHIAVDCSGLVGYAYKQAGINIPAGTSGQIGDTSHAVSPSSPIHPADLLYPKRGHVVMSLGGNKIVHAPKTGDFVKVQDLYFKPQYIRRYLGNTEGATANMNGIGSGASAGSSSQDNAERPKTLAEKLSDAKSNIGKLMAGYVTSSMLGEEFSQTDIDNILNPNAGKEGGGSFSSGPVGSSANLGGQIDKFNDAFNSAGQKYGVDPNIMKAIAMQESGGDPKCGYPNRPAWGLMQIENTLKSEYAQYGQQNGGGAYSLQDRLDPNKAIPFATYRFASDLKHYSGDYAKAIQSYNFSKYSLDKLIAHTGANWRANRANVGQYNGTHSKRYGDPKYIEHVVRYYKGQNQAINSLKGGNGNKNKSQFRATQSFIKGGNGNKNKSKLKGFVNGGFGNNKIKPIKYNIFDNQDNVNSYSGISSLPINEYTNIINNIDNQNSSNDSNKTDYNNKLNIIIKLLYSIFSNSSSIKDLLNSFNNDFKAYSDASIKKNAQNNNNNDNQNNTTNMQPIAITNQESNRKSTGINKAYENAKMIARGIY